MNACIFVPSHIHYDNQINLLSRCLTSLLNQTKKINIHVSLSYNKRYKTKIDKKILQKFNNVSFMTHNKQLYQMEHIYELTKIYASKYDLIMFCDDDDTYKNIRVEKMLFIYDQCKDMIRCGVNELVESDKNIPEFWRYMIRSEILVDFFSRFKKKNQMMLLKHIYADMYLRIYLRKINMSKNEKIDNYIAIPVTNKDDELYQYNIDNKDSICATIMYRPISESMYNNMFLQITTCTSDDEFKKISSEYNLGPDKTNTLYKIYHFCNDYLYE